MSNNLKNLPVTALSTPCLRALTRATLVEMVRDPNVRAPFRNIMIEVEAVARQLAIKLPASIGRRSAGADLISRGGKK